VLVLSANTLLRPLVNTINRKPLDVESTEVTNAVFVVAERLHQRLAIAMLQDVLEHGGYPPGDIDIKPFGDEEVVIEATLAAQSVQGDEMDALVQQLSLKPGVRQAFWSPSTHD
jgi:putative Mg2+ transporter-C (MgtC) family protein